MIAPVSSVEELKGRLGEAVQAVQETRDGIPTVWVPADRVLEALRFLKQEAATRYPMLMDLTAIDERSRKIRDGQPDSDFTVVYLLFSLDGAREFRLKVALKGEYPSLPTCTGIWTTANWYEREVFDMFGIRFEGHPFLQRILMPRSWEGHPLRKEHPARATEMGRFRLWDEKEDMLQNDLEFKPEEWGMAREGEDTEYLFLNIGPQHPGTHGVLRFMLQLDGEILKDCQIDCGYHHRGAEKMSERQSWHSFIPYTDRVDYLGGVMNNLPYVMAVEKLAGIEVPDRVKTIRVMLCELFRISSHLVFYGTYTQDVGQCQPGHSTCLTTASGSFPMIEAICGARMHPATGSASEASRPTCPRAGTSWSATSSITCAPRSMNTKKCASGTPS
jgi:NADH-quinone oxidoreductase subunit C/D